MKSEIIQIAKETINEEARTLNKLSDSLGSDFEEVVEILFQCKGRIIITGMGKSALIAQKIVATLNSTGSPSIYMHAGDAVHGDLGMVTKDDILICLSKSGQTSELKLILPFVKVQGTKVVAICSQEGCFLTQNCDYHLHIPVDTEAEPNNIVPTASTTAQLALGDAIAISLLSLRGFSKEDFASFHPGGSLGKQLFLKVADLYPKNERPHVKTDSNLREVILEMTSKRLGATAVVNENEMVLGIITDGDLRRMLQSERSTDNIQARDIMTSKPISINAGSLAYEAFSLLRQKSITQLIVVENERYVGMLHLHDFINEGFI